ncbi:hypothetical protein MNB_SUP05-SYMBIONT-4-1413 [hydrothermal vent metagenome]|uniref:Uncharacterized protein n=1 Tax=hydrothermal vent metagenome TaxID=652676 RepID=A0A1W1DUP9_9ZZZZ
MYFHPLGEKGFWLKPLYQLGFLCFFVFYFWIRDIKQASIAFVNNKNIILSLKDFEF